MLNGVILIDKPDGYTSFDVVAKVRGILHIRKIGHSGTLDPMATGVLPVFAGNAAKAVSVLPVKDKSYTADFKLGLVTDTYDITGMIKERRDACVTKEQLERVLEGFRGIITQKVPMYSAVKVNGQKLCDLARKGIEIDRPERQVRIDRLTLDSYDEKYCEGTLSVTCSEGTYVRSIIHDMGTALGCGSVMTALERTSANGFTIDRCITLEDLERMRDEDRLEEAVIPIEKVFGDYPEIRLTQKQSEHYRNGVRQSVGQFGINADDSLYRVYSHEGYFFGLGKAEAAEGVLRVYKNLGGGKQ